eukprot:7244823-Pyramimonas_sp.AAC.1
MCSSSPPLSQSRQPPANWFTTLLWRDCANASRWLASLRPRYREPACAQNGRLVLHNRRGRGGADRWALFSASLRPRWRAEASVRVGDSGGRGMVVTPTS